jgi:C-terminal processing protease CtpA/Prc
MGWFLGDAQLSLIHTPTGAETTIVYRADVNLDHQFDEADTISGLNLFCLTSPVSFSCGNLVPWAFKADGRVTLLGRVTGGGSCSVLFTTTAWGTSYQLSGPNRISFLKNGAYYDVDRGVEPDYFIKDYRTFYDREALTEIINNISCR